MTRRSSSSKASKASPRRASAKSRRAACCRRCGWPSTRWCTSSRGAARRRSGAPAGEKSFEWSANSMFLLPRHHFHQFSNTPWLGAGAAAALQLLPAAAVGESGPGSVHHHQSGRRWRAARVGRPGGDVRRAVAARRRQRGRDLEAPPAGVGRQLLPGHERLGQARRDRGRGAGGRSVAMGFPGSEISCHMSMFPSRTYKKAHRHGPGRAIVIPAGEGYSVMWEEGKDKVIAPWKPGQPDHAAEQVVPPALQRRSEARALPGISSAVAVRRPRGERRGSRARPDRIRRRGRGGAFPVRVRVGQAWPGVAFARRRHTPSATISSRPWRYDASRYPRARDTVNPYDYHAPTSLQETFDLLHTYGEDAHLMAAALPWSCCCSKACCSPATSSACRK